MAITTNGLQLARIAGAVFNQQLSASDYSEILAANKTAAELDAWANAAVAAEFRNKTTTDIAKAVLNNVGLSSVAGLENWVAGQLNAGGGLAKAGATMFAMLNDFSNMSAQDATYGAAVTIFNLKAANSQMLSQTPGTKTGTYSAIPTVESGSTFTLTSSTDVFPGTSGSDTFNGVIQANGATGTTIAPGDVVNGGSGVDTLNISVAGALATNGYTLSAVQTTGVEKVLVNNFNTNDSLDNTFDTALMSGVTTVGVSASDAAGDSIFTGMTSIVAAEMNNGSGDLTLTYNAAAVAGTADSQTLNVSNLSAGTFTSDGIETLNINTGLVKSTLTNVASNALKTINVPGATDLTISTALTNATINASAATGAVSVLLGSASHSVTGGAGNDTIDAAGQLSSADTINGGSGTDTLKLTSGNATVAVGTSASKGALFNVSGIEIIDVAATADTAVLDLDATSGVTTVVAAANTKTVTFTGAAGAESTTATITFVLNGTTYTSTANLSGDAAADVSAANTAVKNTINGIAGGKFLATAGTTGAITVTALTGEALEIVVTDQTGATAAESAYSDVSFTNITTQAVDVFSADAVTASLIDASGTADVLNINLKTLSADKGFDHSVGTVTANLIETINLSVTGMTDLKVTTVAALTGSAVKTLNITGDSDLTISAFTSSTALTTIDGSTASGDLVLAEAPAAKDQSIKTGSGNDTIIMGAYLTAADTIDGGANNTATGSTTIGTDKLTATGNIGTVTTAAALKIANVENIEIATGGAAATYIDAAAITGASNIAASSTSGTVKLTNLAAGTKIGLGIGTGEAASTFDLTLTDATGAADSITVDYSDTIDASTSNTLKIAAAVETLNVSASKVSAGTLTSTLVNTDMAAKNIVVTDGADTGAILALGTLNAATTNVDASKYAGIVTVTTAATGAVTVSANGKVANNVTTGAGADTITLAGTAGTTVQTIAGGTGNDILNITVDSSASDFTSVSAVETINITVGGNKQAGVDDSTKDNGLNLATTLNILGGDALSSFTFSSTGVITDAGSVTTIDASSFNGKIALVLDSDALDANLTIKGGALLTDTVTTTVSTATTAEVVKSMTGVEILVLNSTNNDTDNRIDLTNVTGLTTLTTQFTTTTNADNLNVSGLASGVKVTAASTNTGDTLIIDLLDKAAADNALTLELVAANYNAAADTLTFTAAGLETLNVSAKNTNAGLLNLAGVAATSSTGNVTVNVSGTGGLTLKGLSSLTNVVNASTATGSIVLASGDRAATAMTITTGEGDDSVAMRHANDVLNGGLGTSDTLVLTPNFVLGGLLVDLTSATDQITTFNGSANAAAQIGFENVDLSGITGSFGADITAIKTGSTITGTANNDVITGGAGVETITATAGNDSASLLGGNDILIMTDTQFDNVSDANNGTYDFGTGTGDTLRISNALSGVDADLVDFSNVEILKATTNLSTLTVGANFKTAGFTTIDSTGVTLATTMSAQGTATTQLKITGFTVNDTAETFLFGGTDAAWDDAVTDWTITAGRATKTGASVADFYTAFGGVTGTAGEIAIFTNGGNTYVYAEGVGTGATDDSFLEIVGVELTTVSATHGALVFHFG